MHLHRWPAASPAAFLSSSLALSWRLCWTSAGHAIPSRMQAACNHGLTTRLSSLCASCPALTLASSYLAPSAPLGCSLACPAASGRLHVRSHHGAMSGDLHTRSQKHRERAHRHQIAHQVSLSELDCQRPLVRGHHQAAQALRLSFYCFGSGCLPLKFVFRPVYRVAPITGQAAGA